MPTVTLCIVGVEDVSLADAADDVDGGDCAKENERSKPIWHAQNLILTIV